MLIDMLLFYDWLLKQRNTYYIQAPSNIFRNDFSIQKYVSSQTNHMCIIGVSLSSKVIIFYVTCNVILRETFCRVKYHYLAKVIILHVTCKILWTSVAYTMVTCKILWLRVAKVLDNLWCLWFMLKGEKIFVRLLLYVSVCRLYIFELCLKLVMFWKHP